MDEQSPATPPTNSAPSAQPAPPPPVTANPAAANTESALPGIPASWPGAFDAYKYSKKAIRTNLETIIILGLIILVINGVSNIFVRDGLGSLISTVLIAPLTAATALAVIAGVREQRLPIGEALGKALPLWLKMIVQLIIIGFLALASLAVFIVPFFFVFPRLTLANYFLVDKKLGPVEAVQASWNATKGSSGKIWGIIGVNILIVLLMLTIIGIPFSIYFLIMYSAAFGVLYEFLNKSQPAVAAAPALSGTPAASGKPASPTNPTPPETKPPATPPVV